MLNQNLKILAIETSCDETAAAVIGVKNNQPVILSNIVSSQIDLHAKTGGVVPEVASRAHMESMIPVVQEALSQEISNSKFLISNKNPNDSNPEKLQVTSYKLIPSELLSSITHIAVTAGPGLIGSLLVGFNTAKAMAYALDLPIIPINHTEGHIYSAFGGASYNNPLDFARGRQDTITKQFPILALTVSGGHTSLTLMRDHGKYETIGQTRDDAAGEAFDKVAKLLDLGYPGGPIVSKLASEYRQSAKKSEIVLPRPMINDKSFNFSFSGLKTAVLEEITNHKSQITNEYREEICSAFEDAAVDVLVTKTLRAAEKYQPKSIILAGGVAANRHLRDVLSDQLKTNSYPPRPARAEADNLLLPPAELCGDNAAMIGLAAYYHILRGDIKKWNQIKIDSNLKI